MTKAEDNDLEKDECLERRGGDGAEAKAVLSEKEERNREEITENKETLEKITF